MTRAECEQRIIDLLMQIQAVYSQYKPENNGLCLATGKTSWAFNYYWPDGKDSDMPIDVTLFSDGTIKTCDKYIYPGESKEEVLPK